MGIDLTTLAAYYDQIPGWTGEVPAGFAANFLGSLTDLNFLAQMPPSPGSEVTFARGPGAHRPTRPSLSWGEAFFEYSAIALAASDAKATFTMMELGGGFAARSVDAALFLRRHRPDLRPFLVVVEAEQTHFAWAKDHFKTNGLDPDEHWLLNVALGKSTTPVLFPIGEGQFDNTVVPPTTRQHLIDLLKRSGQQAMDGALWNLLAAGRMGVALHSSTAPEGRTFDYGFVSAVPLRDVIAPLPAVDLIDMDPRKDVAPRPASSSGTRPRRPIGRT